MTLSHAWIERIHSLPVLPQVATKITERIQSPTATLKEIADLIRSDVGLSTTILKLANSSYYSVPGGVADVSKALQYLGFTTIAQSVLTASFIGAFKASGSKEFPLSQFWSHSFGVGVLSEITARTLQMKNAGDAFIAGLMHDVGKLVRLELAPDEISKIVAHAKNHKTTFYAAEIALGLTTHVAIGEEFGKFWKLPESIIAAIHSHHSTDLTERKNTPLQSLIVQWADAWINLNHIGNSGNYSEEEFKTVEAKTASVIGLSASKKELIESQFQKEFEKAGAILSGN